MLRAGLVLSILVATLVAVAPAHAQTPTARQFAEGAVSRARRSIAIGPLVGAGIAYAPSPGDVDVPLSFGLGAAWFKVKVVPSPSMIQAMIIERSKDKVAERVEGMIARGEPAPDSEELARIGREVLDEVKAEILGYHQVRGKTLERPRLTVALEGTYLPRAGGGQVRATIGIGINRFTIGPTLAGHFAGPNGLYVGGEVAVHLTPRQGPRPPVIDLYVRYDYGATSGTKGADQLGLGMRVMLDLI